MKIECKDDKIIIYLYRYYLDLDNIEKLNKEIRNLFVKLIKTYKLKLFGYHKVHLYHNKKYGNVLEIDKIYEDEFHSEIIDLKIIIHDDTKFFIEFDDWYFKEARFNEKNGKYYLNIDNIDNLYPYLEFGKLIYSLK